MINVEYKFDTYVLILDTKTGEYFQQENLLTLFYYLFVDF